MQAFRAVFEPSRHSAAAPPQPQPQRFNQPINFVSSGTVGTDPMEIRPALQRDTDEAAAAPSVATSAAAAADMSNIPQAAADSALPILSLNEQSAQLGNIMQAVELPQAAVSLPGHGSGEF